MSPTLDELDTRLTALEGQAIADRISNNLLVIGSDGTVNAKINGSVQMAAAPASPGGPAHSVEWLDQNGIAVAQLTGYTTNTYHALVARDQSPDAANYAEIDLVSDPTNSYVNVNVASGANHQVDILLDANDRSSFWRKAGTYDTAKMLAGTFANLAIPAGANVSYFPLSAPWNTAHLICIANIVTSSARIDVAHYGSGPYNLSTGYIVLGSPVAQTVSLQYISTGY